MILLFLIGCVSLEEQYNKAYACKESLVLDESGDTRTRTTDEIDRDCGFDKYYRRLEMQAYMKRKPVCPEGYIVMCGGPSCGRSPRNEGDLRDYSCVPRGDIGRMINGH